MSMQALPEVNVLKLTAQEYVNIHTYIYEIPIPNTATVFLAINRESVDSPEVLVHPDNSGTSDPKNLKAVLNCNSSYGGTRAEPPVEGDYEQSRLNALESLLKLSFYESHTKHKYLSKTNEKGALDELISPESKIKNYLKAQNEAQKDIPEGYDFSRDFLKLEFRGGRAIILSENLDIHEIIVDASHPKAYEVYSSIFKEVGKFLNGQTGATKIDFQGNVVEEDSFIPAGALFITPDFGPNKRLADYLHEHTPQVLGVDASVGGGGGKAAYTVSGFFGAFDAASEQGLFNADDENLPISLIGAAGAMGSDTAKRLAEKGFKNVLVSDIAYDYTKPVETDSTTGEKLVPILESERYRMNGEAFQRIPSSWGVALAEPGKFTDEALGKNGEPRVIIAMTFGKALKHSNLDAIPYNSTVLLSENWAIPPGDEGLEIMKALKDRGIMALQGQAITPGGAGNSKVEIFFRATENGGITKAMENEQTPTYHKRLGHEIVYRQVKQGASDLLTLAKERDITTIEALAEYTNLPVLARNFVLQKFL
ncbi:MAG: hypothetical protein F6K50_30400 [Moorea sp. SIO3I7]|uniref:hypothetical protein n=2 Tax=Moorena TaxID=1155738 RepID=UPI0013CCE1E6|nr:MULTISPECIES: hypothetical protein [unclassified Moorena]NEN99633.1 hypothetical protein [Moorena sp. SIO3I7]NEO13077.1 hypothetical protein [Moorena sp. SIO3E8]NEP98095.1 hypothetical protein [Moorena sp. SIO3F7]NEQ62093.1 hypothetical protein [Moorena sp. SIO4A1]